MSSRSAPALSASPTVTCYWSFKTVWKASVVVLSRYRFIFEFYAKSIHSFILSRCQGWLSKRLDEGSYSDGLHPQLSVQMWGSYGEALDRHLTSEGAILSPWRRHQVRPSVLLIIRIQSHIVILYITIISPFLQSHSL